MVYFYPDQEVCELDTLCLPIFLLCLRSQVLIELGWICCLGSSILAFDRSVGSTSSTKLTFNADLNDNLPKVMPIHETNPWRRRNPSRSSLLMLDWKSQPGFRQKVTIFVLFRINYNSQNICFKGEERWENGLKNAATLLESILRPRFTPPWVA
jgi:hypothetical protein